MVPLARRSLLYEWRRFLPAALAVAFSGVLLMVQAALVYGIFGSAAVYINQSGGDLWVGFPGTQTVELGRPIPSDSELHLMMDPAVARVEPFAWVDGDWRGPRGRGGVSVFISGIDPRPDAMLFAHALGPDVRVRLDEPGAVIVDRADLPKLGVDVGGVAVINGQRVHVVAAGHGLRALGGVNILTSLATARRLDQANGDGSGDDVDYYVVKLRDPGQAAAVSQRLMPTGSTPRYEVWTSSDFARRAVRYWLFETGAGLGVVLIAVLVFFVGAIITSQSLMGAVAGSIREYATLHALGVGMRDLRRVVVQQAGWLGLLGLVIGCLFSAAILFFARSQDVPVQLDPVILGVCAVLVMGIALMSGVLAVRVLRRADPALLLR